MKTTDFAKHLTAFFTEYLIGERGVSPNTIRSYSESFSLLLNFLDEQVNIKADNLRLEHITRKTVLTSLIGYKTRKNRVTRLEIKDWRHYVLFVHICNMRM